MAGDNGKMINKNTNTKKYDKFAIWSFVFAILIFTIPVFIALLDKTFLLSEMGGGSVFFILFFLSPPTSTILSLIFGLISLKRTKKNNKLKGKLLSWAGIIISSLFVLYLMYALSQFRLFP